jgi:tetratricopeptide (TPR) repeat protein
MQRIALVLSIGLMLAIPASASGTRVEIKYDAFLNRITGQVWGPGRQPVSNIYVELNNEVNSTVGRQRTSNAGLYEFSNISAGLFRVHVLTLGTDYLEQTKEVQILNLVTGMSDNQYCDFELKFDPRRVSSAAGSPGRAEEVFAQQGVTPEAEKLYNKGRDLLMDKKSDAAIAAFKQALAIFPNYYYANSALGKELVERAKYQESFPYLIKAIDANQRSFDSYYALAFGTFQLKQMTEAKAAAQAAVVLRPSSLNAQLLLGTILRQGGNLPEAEKVLVKAKTIGENKVPAVNWQLALVYNRMNRNKEAIAELETYVKNEPNGVNKNDANDMIAKLKTAKNQ